MTTRTLGSSGKPGGVKLGGRTWDSAKADLGRRKGRLVTAPSRWGLRRGASFRAERTEMQSISYDFVTHINILFIGLFISAPFLLKF